jgi:hypothetical protein
MRTYSPTTMAGTAAALAMAASQIPGLTPFQASLLTLASAVAIGLLGRCSSDCPAKCPGSDAQGRRLPSPQLYLPLPPLVVAAGVSCALLLFAGCTIANRSVTTSFAPSPDGSTNRLVSMTQSSSVRTVLTTVSGFTDSVSAAGASHTAIGNYSGDVNMANAIFTGLRSTIGAVVLASGNTNLLGNTNLMSVLGP